jgi:uncharacterized membrane protein HdeD (DUF308 family)
MAQGIETSPAQVPADRMEEMSRALAQNWWAFVLRGILAILFGLLALFTPGAVMLTLAIFFAAYLLVDGVFEIVGAVRAARAEQRWGLLLAEGVLSIVMGIIAFLFPVGAVLGFVLVTAAWSLVTGALEIAAAIRLTKRHGRGWLAFSGIVSVLFGVALVIAPLIGAVVLTWWLGIYAIAFGVALLVLGFKLRKEQDRGAPAHTAASPA